MVLWGVLYFVCYAHQGIFHIVLHFGYQLYAAREKILE